MKLPEGTTVLDLGNGFKAVLVESAKVEFVGNPSVGMIAEACVAANRPELVSLLDHKDEKGRDVSFSPVTAEKLVVDDAQIVETESGIIPTTEAEREAEIDRVFAEVRKENEEKQLGEGESNEPKRLDENSTKHEVADALLKLTVKVNKAIVEILKLELPADANRKDEIVGFVVENAEVSKIIKAMEKATAE